MVLWEVSEQENLANNRLSIDNMKKKEPTVWKIGGYNPEAERGGDHSPLLGSSIGIV
ncbi:hypothetical protein ACFLVE_01765 [Chloroflexota bacterium]